MREFRVAKNLISYRFAQARGARERDSIRPILELLLTVTIGFALGYWVRDAISRRRYQVLARKRSLSHE